MIKMTICGVNIAEFAIVLPEQPVPAENTAAAFLKDVIEKSCGVVLPISHNMTDHSIVIGAREIDPDIKWDGFRTVTDDGSLTCGREADLHLEDGIYVSVLLPARDPRLILDVALTELGFNACHKLISVVLGENVEAPVVYLCGGEHCEAVLTALVAGYIGNSESEKVVLHCIERLVCITALTREKI